MEIFIPVFNDCCYINFQNYSLQNVCMFLIQNILNLYELKTDLNSQINNSQGTVLVHMSLDLIKATE